MLFKYEWELVKSPAGAHQWRAKNVEEQDLIPDAHDPSIKHSPMMTTADLSLRFDSIYEPIARKFHQDPQAFADAFARAWFKLTHRDMGPRSRYLGPEAPKEELLWQDPLPPAKGPKLTDDELKKLRTKILKSGLTTSQLVTTAWASASTFRGSDRRGGANGARIRLAPQKDWEINQPEELASVLQTLEAIQETFNKSAKRKKLSLADLIVFAGGVAIEEAAKNAGHKIKVPFTPGRTDATEEQTDCSSFAVLEPQADGFRNYARKELALQSEEFLLDKAQLLKLTAPEMTVLMGGLRVLQTNFAHTKLGVFTSKPGTLTNDFFVHLLDMKIEWKPSTTPGEYEGFDRKSGKLKWVASRVDLIFGSNSELRALAEVYAQDDAHQKFLADFVQAWTKVMNLDRYDLKRSK